MLSNFVETYFSNSQSSKKNLIVGGSAVLAFGLSLVTYHQFQKFMKNRTRRLALNRKGEDKSSLKVLFHEFSSTKFFQQTLLEKEIILNDAFELQSRKDLVEKKNEVVQLSDVIFTSKWDYSLKYRTKKRCFKVFFLPGFQPPFLDEITEEEFVKYNKLIYSNGYDLMFLPVQNYTYSDDEDDEEDENFHVDIIGFLITPEGGRIEVTEYGEFFDFIYKRINVSYFGWKRIEEKKSDKLLKIFASKKELRRALSKSSKMVRFAQECHLLFNEPGNTGNLAFRLKDGSDYFLITPHYVDKNIIKTFHFVLCKMNFQTSNLEYWGDINKPSVDSGCRAFVLSNCKNIISLFHFHYQKYLFVFPLKKTVFNYPVGSLEDPRETLKVLSSEKFRSSDSDSFCIDLVHHGYLVGLTKEDYNGLFDAWENDIVPKILKNFGLDLERKSHVKRLKKQLYPIFFNYKVQGGVLRKLRKTRVEKERVLIYLKKEVSKEVVLTIKKEIEKRELLLGKLDFI